MRRYLWGVLLLLGVMALVAHPVVVTQVEPPRAVVVMPPPPPEFVQAEARPPAAPKPPARQLQTVSRKVRLAPKPVEDPSAVVWQTLVETPYLPEAAAFEKAHDTVLSLLTHELNLKVVPPLEFITQSPKWMTLDWTSEKGPVVEVGDGQETTRVTMKAYLTAAGWRELEQRERSHLKFQRIEGTARGLMALTVLLGVVAGYIRLDEWTKGYYTGRLRLAAVVLVAAAGALMVA